MINNINFLDSNLEKKKSLDNNGNFEIKKDDFIIEFDPYEIFLYSRNGTYICHIKTKEIWENGDSMSKMEESNIIDNNVPPDSKHNNTVLLITKLIKNFCISDFSKNKKNEGIHYNTIYLGNIKIIFINIPTTNTVAVGIFSKDTKSSIIRLFLLNIIISYLNYSSEKANFYKFEELKDINSIQKINQKNLIENLNNKIYDTFLSIPIQIHFGKNIQKVFKKRVLYFKDIYYQNYYLIDLNSDKIILSKKYLDQTYKDIGSIIRMNDQKYIWDELLTHCHNLKDGYIKQNKMNFNRTEYQYFFVKIEYNATFPKRTFIIKFLPILDGICIIHEYYQLKLYIKGDDNVKKYQEKSIIYGYDAYDNIFINNTSRFFENEHSVLKLIHFFIIESLFYSNSSSPIFFVLDKSPKIYFSNEILEIIEKEVIQFFEKNKNFQNYNFSKKLIKIITSNLYEKYIQINSGEQILQKSSSTLLLSNSSKELNIKDIIFDKPSNSMQLSKNNSLIYLFNSLKFNNNINPNDVTIDLNDYDKDKSIRCSNLSKKSRKSFNLIDLLEEKEVNKSNIIKKNNTFQMPNDSLFNEDVNSKFLKKGKNNIDDNNRDIKKRYIQIKKDNKLIPLSEKGKKNNNNDFEFIDHKISIKNSFETFLKEDLSK